MRINWTGARVPLPLLWPAAFVAAVAVALAVWVAQDTSRALPAAVALAGAASFGAVWLRRARAARRWSAVVNAYAERELARARRMARPQRPGPAALASLLQNHRLS
jgi:hypothetical protein